MVIHAFGDEHTLGFKYDKKTQVAGLYRFWLQQNGSMLDSEPTYKPLDNTVWIEKISKRFNCEYVLHAESETTNQNIFSKFLNNVDNIKEGDIVILNWTYNFRFNVYGDEDSKIASSVTDDLYIQNKYNFNSQTISDIYKNRSSITATEEVHIYENAIIQICKQKKVQVFFWSSDDLNHLVYDNKTLKKDEYILGEHIISCREGRKLKPKNKKYFDLSMPFCYACINYSDGLMFPMDDETWNQIQSRQYLGERGHDVLAHYFYSYLVKKIKNKSVVKNLLL